MASFFRGGKFQQFLKKYGKVALGVHFSVSGASIAGIYVAIKNNVDVESILKKVGISAPQQIQTPNPEVSGGGEVLETRGEGELVEVVEKRRNRTAEMAASSGGALALAVLCNKALFPVRVPITIALTPPIARFLARRKIIKGNM